VSRLTEPMPVKPVAALFAADAENLARAARALEERLGPIDYISRPFRFDQTVYYEPEMGGPLVKRFLSAERLMDPADLVDLKVFTIQLEADFSQADRRRVNIDPGYVSPERLVLATGKNYLHRIYLGRGVYADLTLIFDKGDFKPLAWTYPDYASPEVRAVMASIRERLLEQLRNRRQP